MDDEKIELGFFEKWKLRRHLKKSRALFEGFKKSVDIINRVSAEEYETLAKDEIKLRESMVLMLIGDEERKVQGLLDIFEAVDEDGKVIKYTKTGLMKEPINDLADMLEDLLNELEKNV